MIGQIQLAPKPYAYDASLEKTPAGEETVVEMPPLFNQRSNGVLMHITSLPSRYGIGSFGAEVRHFADLLKAADCTAWQVLPFCPPDSCYSPYKSVSSFAGNTLMLDLDQMEKEGYLTRDEVESCVVHDPWSINFPHVIYDRDRVYALAFSRIHEGTIDEIRKFVDEEDWALDYALFMAISEEYTENWDTWPVELRTREPKALEDAYNKYASRVLYHLFLQMLFKKQWSADKAYINSLGIKVIGDMPFYVSYESSDVWANQKLFALDEEGKMKDVAGVPPDFFSKTGQLWGNPLYDWKAMKAQQYKWWMQRIGHALKIYDVLRIDHFRAFASYYAIPADEDTAMNGVWHDGPGYDFFKVLQNTFKNPEIIAEDLGGESAPEVMKLLKETGLPGMRVMEMAFIEWGDNPHYPFNYIPNCVAYLGTHDNNTLMGYLKEDLTEEQRQYCLQYVGLEDAKKWEEYGPNSDTTHAFIRAIWSSAAGLTIVQLQDLMGYASDARMNLPGTAEGNWKFRIARSALDELNVDWLKFFNMTYQRSNPVGHEDK